MQSLSFSTTDHHESYTYDPLVFTHLISFWSDKFGVETATHRKIKSEEVLCKILKQKKHKKARNLVIPNSIFFNLNSSIQRRDFKSATEIIVRHLTMDPHSNVLYLQELIPFNPIFQKLENLIYIFVPRYGSILLRSGEREELFHNAAYRYLDLAKRHFTQKMNAPHRQYTINSLSISNIDKILQDYKGLPLYEQFFLYFEAMAPGFLKDHNQFKLLERDCDLFLIDLMEMESQYYTVH